MTAPEAIEWSELSPASQETIKHVMVRIAAGWTYEEVAVAMERERPELRHVPLPPRGTFTKGWVAARARELRPEIERTGAATY